MLGQDWCWLAAPALAQAPANTLEEVKKRGVVRVGVRQDVPGFGIVDEKGETVGFDVDIANEMASGWASRSSSSR